MTDTATTAPPSERPALRVWVGLGGGQIAHLDQYPPETLDFHSLEILGGMLHHSLQNHNRIRGTIDAADQETIDDFDEFFAHDVRILTETIEAVDAELARRQTAGA